MRVRLHADADSELIDAAAWIGRDRPAVGERFLESFDRARQRLEQYRRIGPPVRRRLRRKRIPGFPYDVVYELFDDEIVILAIAHHSRRPGYWRDRRSVP